MYAYRVKRYRRKRRNERRNENDRKRERKRKILNLAYLAEHRISIIIIGGLDFESLVCSFGTRNFVLSVSLQE